MPQIFSHKTIFEVVSNLFLVSILSVTYSKYEDIVFQNSIDYPVDTDAKFTKPCKLSFQDWIVVSIF